MRRILRSLSKTLNRKLDARKNPDFRVLDHVCRGSLVKATVAGRYFMHNGKRHPLTMLFDLLADNELDLFLRGFDSMAAYILELLKSGLPPNLYSRD